MDSELVEEGVGGDKGKEFHALKGEEVPGTEMGYRDEVTVIRKAHRVISHKTDRESLYFAFVKSFFEAFFLVQCKIFVSIIRAINYYKIRANFEY